jgi:ribonuclease D
MSVLPPLPVEIVNQPSQLDAAVKAMLGSPDIALDTESNSFHHYPEQLCLIQAATCQRVYIIDTIMLKDPGPLKKVLEEPYIRKVIHGADYDIRCFDRHYGFRIRNLYDTSIAARFSGIERFGLAALLEDLVGVTINKSKRLQRADWGRRPLSAEALDYASTDVRYLFALKDILEQRLKTLGRTAWAAEEYARLEEVRYNPPNLENAYFSIKGAYKLNTRGLAIIRSLFRFREEQARRLHRPPFFVMPDDALLSLATSPAMALSEVPGLGPGGVQQFGNGLRQAIRDGQSAPPVSLPPVTEERCSQEQMQRLTRLKAWRTTWGETLTLDPSLLWPTVSLERLARSPHSLEAEFDSPDIRSWQKERFAASLRSDLKSRM